MTRINLIPAKLLLDQHLWAELREIPKVGKLAQVFYKKWKCGPFARDWPKDYTLGTGHLMFFYDKGMFIVERNEQLLEEAKSRGLTLSGRTEEDLYYYWSELDSVMFKSYTPTKQAMNQSVFRVMEKVSQKPFWYKMNGINLTQKSWEAWIKKMNALL